MLVFAMCQIAASGLKLFQNCIMNQKCIVYNDWNFCTRFKTSNIWWQPQTVIHLSGELIAQWFTLVFVLVQSQSIVGTNSGILCVNIVGGGGGSYWLGVKQPGNLLQQFYILHTFLFKNSCFPELSLSIYGHVIQEM